LQPIFGKVPAFPTLNNRSWWMLNRREDYNIVKFHCEKNDYFEDMDTFHSNPYALAAIGLHRGAVVTFGAAFGTGSNKCNIFILKSE